MRFDPTGILGNYPLEWVKQTPYLALGDRQSVWEGCFGQHT